MKYKLFFGLFFGILSQSIYSQSNSIEVIWHSILRDLNIPENIYYENIESAFFADEIIIKVIKRNNK
jgi:hypothetical protein